MEPVKKNEDTQQRTEEEQNDQEGDGVVAFESEPATNAIKEVIQNMTQVEHAGLSSQTNPPIYIDVDSGRKRKSRGLQQGYCVVPSAKRFIVLYSFLKRNLSKKVMVFFSSCNSVKYHSELLRHSEIDCFDIHRKQNQLLRTSNFLDFCKAENGILLCNDAAARDLDIPSVDWIILYDPPYEYKEFIDRVYSTAYREGAKETNVLLFLIPEELQFCRKLKAAKVLMNEYITNENKLENVQPNLEKLVANNDYLKKSAKDAYKSYLVQYNSHYLKEIFNVHKLDLKAVAASFCLCDPLVNINIE